MNPDTHPCTVLERIWFSVLRDLFIYWLIQKLQFTFVIILIILNTFLFGTNITESFMLQLRGYVKGAVNYYTQKISLLPEKYYWNGCPEKSCLCDHRNSFFLACQKTSQSESLSACQSFWHWVGWHVFGQRAISVSKSASLQNG